MLMEIIMTSGHTTTLWDMIGQMTGEGKQRQLVVDLDLVAGGLSQQETFVLVQFNGHVQ